MSFYSTDLSDLSDSSNSDDVSNYSFGASDDTDDTDTSTDEEDSSFGSSFGAMEQQANGRRGNKHVPFLKKCLLFRAYMNEIIRLSNRVFQRGFLTEKHRKNIMEMLANIPWSLGEDEHKSRFLPNLCVDLTLVLSFIDGAYPGRRGILGENMRRSSSEFKEIMEVLKKFNASKVLFPGNGNLTSKKYPDPDKYEFIANDHAVTTYLFETEQHLGKLCNDLKNYYLKYRRIFDEQLSRM